MSIQEKAQHALTEHQAYLAVAERERQLREAEVYRRYIHELVPRVLEIPAGDPRLNQVDPDGAIAVDGLRFRVHRPRNGDGRVMVQVELDCYLCNQPCWQDVVDLVVLGDMLTNPAGVVHLGYTCQEKEENEEAERPAAPRPKRCPLARPNDDGDSLLCFGERCAWWQRCQQPPIITELSEVVEYKAERPVTPPEWALVELMGHGHLVGQIREATIAGAAMIAVDVPAVGEQAGYTKSYGRSAIYAITPVDEATARAMLEYRNPPPAISLALLPYELRSGYQPAGDHDDEEGEGKYEYPF